MVNQGFSRTISDHCVFVKKVSADDFIILLLYVDDMLIVGHDASKIEKLKRELRSLSVIPDEIILETWARQNKGTPGAS